MTPTTDQLYQAAMALPEDERAELAGRLLDSLAPDTPSQLHPAWREELRRRLAQVDSGEVNPVPWSEVKRSAWEALDQDEAAPHG
jgi:putative addiction module component (TIGR02574 family)